MTLDFEPDFRQKIAETWPNSLDDELSLRDWDWKYDVTPADLAKKILDGIAPEYKTKLTSTTSTTTTATHNDKDVSYAK